MNFSRFFRKKPIANRLPTVAAKLPDGVELSPELSAYKAQIGAAALPFIRIEATPAEALSLTESKFAGTPYWPAHLPYPKDSNGEPMLLLAQLNFSEIPPLEAHPDKGLLQFYIGNNDVYGINFDSPTEQSDFRVLYFEDADETIAEKSFSFLTESDTDSLPVSQPMRLQFAKATDYTGSDDVRFEKTFGKNFAAFVRSFGENKDAVSKELYDKFPNDGHKIGGYAYFTQEDPRGYKKEFEDWILLLQIDSQGNEIVWGDVGVANFFIHPDALKRKDFSAVMYNWDCC